MSRRAVIPSGRIVVRDSGMSEGNAVGFTVGPVMPAARDGGAGDGQRYRKLPADCRFGQGPGFGSVWAPEHRFTDYHPSPSPLLFLSHVAAACPGYRNRPGIDRQPTLSYSIFVRDIDTKLLRSFLVVATEKSFSTAAERLGCSQGTMSVRIQTLEEQLGYQLFDRGRHNVKITAAGQDLLPQAQALVDLHDRLIDRAATRQVSGRVRLGVGEDHGSELFARLRRHLHEGYTAIELDIVCRTCRVLTEDTRRGALDLAIVTSLEEIRSGTLLSRRRLQWVASKDFVFDETVPLPVACLPEGCSLRESGLAALEGRDIAWRVALCSPSEEIIRDTVSAGAAITVMTEGTVPGDLKAIVRPSLLPPLGKAWIQLLEKPGEQSGAVQAVKREVVNAFQSG